MYLIVACFKLSNHSNLSFLSLILMTCNLFSLEASVKYSLMPRFTVARKVLSFNGSHFTFVKPSGRHFKGISVEQLAFRAVLVFSQRRTIQTGMKSRRLLLVKVLNLSVLIVLNYRIQNLVAGLSFDIQPKLGVI